MIRVLTLSFLLFISHAVHAQQSLQCMAYNGFVKQDVLSWDRAIDEYESHSAQGAEELKNYTLTLYGFVGILYVKDQKERAKLYNERLEETIAKLEGITYDEAFLNAMSGACHGYKVMLNSPASSMYNLMKCLSFVDDAVKADSLSPYGWTELGNVKFQMTRFLGGSYSDVASYYVKSIQIFETSGQDLSCNWYYINSLLFLAKCFEEQKKPEQAVAIYEKIISLAPEFDGAKRWMKKQNDLIRR